MNGWTDGCLAPTAVSTLKWWSACLQQDGAAHTGCVENVWTVCKTKAWAERALSEECVTAGELCSHDSLQIPLTDEVPNGVKVSECITLQLHPSLSLTLFLLLLLHMDSLRLLIHPPSLPLKTPLSLHLMWLRLASRAKTQMTFQCSSSESVVKYTELSATFGMITIMTRNSRHF